MSLRKVNQFPIAIWFRVPGSEFGVKKSQPETLNPEP
jgi:hypothetical protein